MDGKPSILFESTAIAMAYPYFMYIYIHAILQIISARVWRVYDGVIIILTLFFHSFIWPSFLFGEINIHRYWADCEKLSYFPAGFDGNEGNKLLLRNFYETFAAIHRNGAWHDYDGRYRHRALCQKKRDENGLIRYDQINKDGSGETCSITYYTSSGDDCNDLKCDSANPQKRCCPGGPDKVSTRPGVTYANGDPNAWQYVRPIPPEFNRL